MSVSREQYSLSRITDEVGLMSVSSDPSLFLGGHWLVCLRDIVETARVGPEQFEAMTIELEDRFSYQVNESGGRGNG